MRSVILALRTWYILVGDSQSASFRRNEVKCRSKYTACEHQCERNYEPFWIITNEYVKSVRVFTEVVRSLLYPALSLHVLVSGMTLILLNILQSFTDYFSKILYDITAYTLTAMVPKLCFADPKGSVSSSKWIRGYISVMAALNNTYF
jgi:hypothetical protein